MVEEARRKGVKEMSPREELSMFKSAYTDVTGITAVAGVWFMKASYRTLQGRSPTAEESTGFKEGMDVYTNAVFEKQLDESEVLSHVAIGEGAKDNAPHIEGPHGAIDGPEKVAGVDPVDGSHLLANGLNGAISFASAARGIKKIPAGYHHAFSLTVPPEAAGVAVLDFTVEGQMKTFGNICEAKNIDPPELTLALLNPNKKGREINHISREAATRMKMPIEIFEAGDVLYRLFSSLSRRQIEDYCNLNNLDPKKHGRHMIAKGRTGYVEDNAISVAPFITGGRTVAGTWTENIAQTGVLHPHTHADTVSGDRNEALVVASFATNNDVFGQPGVVEHGNGWYTVKTLILTAEKGIEIITKTFRFLPDEQLLSGIVRS